MLRVVQAEQQCQTARIQSVRIQRGRVQVISADQLPQECRPRPA